MSLSNDLPESLRGLAALGQRGDLEIRPVLLRVLTDLYVSRPCPSLEESRQFEAIALGLVEQIDDRARVLIARKLAGVGSTPMALLEKFISFGGAAAWPFLAHSTQTPRAILLETAANGPSELAAAVAGRIDLDIDIVRALAARSDMEPIRVLARNPASPIPRDVFSSLARRARRDAFFASALCERASDTDDITPLFLHASSAQRANIILAARRADLGALPRAARVATEASVAEEIEAAVIRRDHPLFVALVARGLGAMLGEARMIIADPRGEPLALALAALRVTPDAAARVFMSLDSPIAQSHERVRTLTKIVADVAPQTARRLVGAMLDIPAGGRPRVERLPVNDTRAASAPSRPASNARPVAAARKPKLLLLRAWRR